MDGLYYEYAPKVFSRTGEMIPQEELTGKVGYRSLYGFTKEAADEVRKAGSSKGLARFPTFSDAFTVDFDDGEKGVKEMLAWAKSQGFGYDLYVSGGKGYHVVVPHTPLFGLTVPLTHKRLAEHLKIPADMSLYHASRLFRLTGTIHERTGNKKTLIESESGEFIMDLQLAEPSKDKFDIQPLELFEEFQFWLGDISRYVGFSPGKGNRFQLLWRLARQGCDYGIDAHTTLGLLSAVNQSWGEDAHEDSHVAKAVTQGYR